MKMSSRVEVRKYLIEYYFLCIQRFITFCWVLVCCKPWSFSGKRWKLTCMEHTRRLLRMQHRKHYSRASYYYASHEKLLVCSARKIVCAQHTKVDSRAAHFVSHVCFDSRHDKNWITHACSSHTSVNLDVSCTVYYPNCTNFLNLCTEQ